MYLSTPAQVMTALPEPFNWKQFLHKLCTTGWSIGLRCHLLLIDCCSWCPHAKLNTELVIFAISTIIT